MSLSLASREIARCISCSRVPFSVVLVILIHTTALPPVKPCTGTAIIITTCIANTINIIIVLHPVWLAKLCTYKGLASGGAQLYRRTLHGEWDTRRTGMSLMCPSPRVAEKLHGALVATPVQGFTGGRAVVLMRVRRTPGNGRCEGQSVLQVSRCSSRSQCVGGSAQLCPVEAAHCTPVT